MGHEILKRVVDFLGLLLEVDIPALLRVAGRVRMKA
jgi:hypothetical protein